MKPLYWLGALWCAVVGHDWRTCQDGCPCRSEGRRWCNRCYYLDEGPVVDVVGESMWGRHAHNETDVDWCPLCWSEREDGP